MQQLKAIPANVRPFNADAPDTGSWPVPQSLIGQITRDDYPVDALPARIRDAILEARDCVQCTVEMAASAALATASVASQALADVRRNAKLVGPASLYFLTIAESGDRKTTTDTLFNRVVYDFQDTQREAAKASVAGHAADLAAWDAKKKATIGQMEGDAKARKGVDGHRADLRELEASKPQPPRVPRLLFTDVTPEKLLHCLAREWPSGGLFSSEGGAVLGSHAMGSDSIKRTLAAYNALWDGQHYTVDRKTGDSFVVRGARMTVSIQVQPHVLSDYLERDRGLSRGSGFLARFLISQPISLQGVRLYREPQGTPALDAFSARIAELLANLPPVDPERNLEPPVLELSPEAKAVWVRLYDLIEQQLGTNGEFAPVRDVASKAADNIVRMAAVLHVFENGATGTIGPDLVESAGRVVLWHLYNARALFGPLTISRELAHAATLDRWLLDRCNLEGVDHFPTRTVLQGGPNPTRRREDFDRAVSILAEHGRIRVASLGRRRIIKINPALLSGGDGIEEDGPDHDDARYSVAAEGAARKREPMTL